LISQRYLRLFRRWDFIKVDLSYYPALGGYMYVKDHCDKRIVYPSTVKNYRKTFTGLGKLPG